MSFGDFHWPWNMANGPSFGFGDGQTAGGGDFLDIHLDAAAVASGTGHETLDVEAAAYTDISGSATSWTSITATGTTWTDVT